MSKAHPKQPNKSTTYLYDPNDLTIVGIDTDDGPEHYLYDSEERLRKIQRLDPAMVKNMRVCGVQDAVKCTKDGERLLVVNGRRRVLHARAALAEQKAHGEAELRIKVQLVQGEEKYLTGIMRTGNEFRMDDSVVTKAKNAARMLDQGQSEEEIALWFGVKPVTVRDWLKLVKLSPKVRGMVERGEMGLAAATVLANLSKAEQDEHVEQLKAEQVQPTERNVKAKKRQRQGKPVTKTATQRVKDAVAAIQKLRGRGKLDVLALQDVVEAVAQALTDKPVDELLALVPEPSEPAEVLSNGHTHN